MPIQSRIAVSAAAAATVALGVVAAVASAQAVPAAAAPRWTAVRAGRMFDGRSARLATNQVILIEGDRIAAVGANLAIPAGAAVIDLSRATVLPGMIDTHIHLFDQQNGQSATARAAVAIGHAARTLDAGFTTAVDLDSRGGYGTVDIRDAINKGIIPGPRLQVAGPSLNQRGAAPYPSAREGLTEDKNLNSPWLARAAVREAKLHGVDWVKAHSDETDDSHAPSHSHPGCSIVPAALAVGRAVRDRRGAPGAGGRARLRRRPPRDVHARRPAVPDQDPPQHAQHRRHVRRGRRRRERRRAERAADAVGARLRRAAGVGRRRVATRHGSHREGARVRRVPGAQRRVGGADDPGRRHRRRRHLLRRRQLPPGVRARRRPGACWSTSSASDSRWPGPTSRSGRWARRSRPRSTRSRTFGGAGRSPPTRSSASSCGSPPARPGP